MVVSLPFEPGREAFKATATLRERLAALARRGGGARARVGDHYAAGSRTALHAPRARAVRAGGRRAPTPATPCACTRAGGERAELELCGAEVLALLRDGHARRATWRWCSATRARYASLVEQVFGAYGIPYSIDRTVPLRPHRRWAAGCWRCCAARCSDGSADDLLAYLRTPGLLREPRLADRLEADVRRRGERTAAGARELWEERPGRWPLDEIDRAARRRPDAAALLAAAELPPGAAVRRALPARRAHVLSGAELDDAARLPRRPRGAHRDARRGRGRPAA